MKQVESRLSEDVAKYLKAKNITYRYDIADMKLTMQQAVRMKKLQMNQRGYPDLFICKPVGKYSGLYIELKKNREEVFKKDGGYKQKKVYKNKIAIYDHIQEQVKCQEKLRENGYCVVWGFGLKDTIEKIETYLEG